MSVANDFITTASINHTETGHNQHVAQLPANFAGDAFVDRLAPIPGNPPTSHSQIAATKRQPSPSAISNFQMAYEKFKAQGLRLNSSQFRVLMELLSSPGVDGKTMDDVFAVMVIAHGSETALALELEYNNLDDDPYAGKYQISIDGNTITLSSPFGKNSFQADFKKPERIYADIQNNPGDLSQWSEETNAAVNTYKVYGTAAIVRTGI